MKALNKNEREDRVVLRISLLLTFAISLFACGIPKVHAAVVYFDTEDSNVVPGEIISVSIFSTEPTSDIRMDRICDDGEGMAESLWLNPGYDNESIFNEGTAVNIDGVLIEDIRGGIGLMSPFVSGILYSFDYTVSQEAINEQTIIIFADSSGGLINEVLVHNEKCEQITPESLILTVVPEPCSIAFISLGVIFMRKFKRQR